MSDLRCVCDPLTRRGSDFSPFIGYWFSQCVYTPRDMAGFLFGVANLFIWFTIHVPQIVKNFKTGDAAALSPMMLGLWVFADVCGTLGLLLTGQKGTILITQFYYLFMDTLLLMQYFYYSRLAKQKKAAMDAASSDSMSINDSDAHKDDHLTTLDDLGAQGDRANPPRTNSALFTSPSSAHVDTSFSINGPSTSNTGVVHSLSNHKVQNSSFVGSQTSTPKNTSNTPSSTQTSFSSGSSHTNIFASSANVIAIAICLVALVSTTEASTLLSLFPLTRSSSTPCSNLLPTSPHDASPNPTALLSILSTIAAAATETSPPSCTGPAPSDAARIVGVISAWFCSIIYSVARLGQVYTNHKRKSTAGLSKSFILLALVAGCLYFSSIMLPSTIYDRTEGLTAGAFWSSTFPYVLSCVCNLILNAYITFQIWTYRAQTKIDLAKMEAKKLADAEANGIPLDPTRPRTGSDRDSGDDVSLMKWNKQDKQIRHVTDGDLTDFEGKQVEFNESARLERSNTFTPPPSPLPANRTPVAPQV